MFEKVFIIAEGGANHNGSLNMAKEMIWAAKESGADAIKFQHFTLETLFSPEYYKKTLNLQNFIWQDEIKKLEFKNEWIPQVKEEAEKAGIIYFSTPFSINAVDNLDNYVPFYKVASGDITFFQLLERLGKTGKGIFLSTGGSKIEEIDEAVELLLKFNPSFICLMHCIMLYPPPSETMNLNFIQTLKKRYNFPTGFSDHTLDERAAILAVGIGAKVIEKHFTLDKTLPGADHKHSMDPEEFKNYTIAIREAEIMMGKKTLHSKTSGGIERIITEGESKERIYARRSAYALKNIKCGEFIDSSNVVFLRPVVGIGADEYYNIMGKRAARNIKKGEPIFHEDIEETN